MSNQVVQELQSSIIQIEADQPAVIAKLCDCLAGRTHADDLLDEQIAEVKSHFGAKAANTVSDAEADGAIAEVEQWVTDNISNRTIERRVAGALTVRSARELLDEWSA